MSDPRSRRRQRAFCGHTPHISQRGDRAGHFLSGILSCSLKLFVVSFWTENATNLWSVNTKNEGSTKRDSALRPKCSSPKSEIIHTIFCRCCRLQLSWNFSSLRLMTLTTGGSILTSIHTISVRRRQTSVAISNVWGDEKGLVSTLSKHCHYYWCQSWRTLDIFYSCSLISWGNFQYSGEKEFDEFANSWQKGQVGLCV